MGVKCPKCGGDGVALMRLFDCSNVRCDNHEYMWPLSSEVRDACRKLWVLHDRITNDESRENIREKIWDLMKL